MPPGFAHHHESSALIAARPKAVFDYLDDPARLAGHMTRSSWMMGGGRMDVRIDAERGQTVGSRIVMKGRAFGLPLELEEAITERNPPTSKVWSTVGAPRLVVIGGYRMGCELRAEREGTRLRVFIDYDLPPRRRWLGRLFARAYARWCTQQMVDDARKHFTRAS